MQASLPEKLQKAKAAPTLVTPGRESERWAQWQQLTEALEPLLLIPHQCPDFLGSVTQQAATLIQLVREDPDLAIFHVVHAMPDQLGHYGVIHAVHTAILVCLIGQRKGWKSDYTAGAIKAALTMNLSITALQNTLAEQTTPLTAEQRDAINTHPADSQKLLRRLGVIDEHWLRAVALHHEPHDNKNFPNHVNEVSQWADVLRTCDVFGAKISPRITRHGILSVHAAEAIFRQRSSGYFGATIIRELALYPPGCMVRLCSGETAIVLRRTRSPMRPEVSILTDTRGRALAQPLRCMTGTGLGRSVLVAVADVDLATRFSPEQLFSNN
ncbi:MAG: hypothetical protein KGL90_11955 [Burkholderiales bacterium]|nr:hypothetical protein [Burkholderiales bacterium]